MKILMFALLCVMGCNTALSWSAKVQNNQPTDMAMHPSKSVTLYQTEGRICIYWVPMADLHDFFKVMDAYPKKSLHVCDVDTTNGLDKDCVVYCATDSGVHDCPTRVDY